MIAGLVQPQADGGKVVFENRKVVGPDEKLVPGHPGIAYLSQHFELRNNYRVEEVLMRLNELTENEAGTLYEICQISHLLKRKTDQISGGEKQRIALARQLSSKPRLLLLDEPFSNLDMIHKNVLKSVIRDVGERLQITCMLISHDPLDTLSWAEEIFVMKEGEICQRGTPEQIYKQPKDEYVAGLFGKYSLLPMENGRHLFVRPEQFNIVKDPASTLHGKVADITFLGSTYEITVSLHENTVTVNTQSGDYVVGDSVYLALPGEVWYI